MLSHFRATLPVGKWARPLACVLMVVAAQVGSVSAQETTEQQVEQATPQERQARVAVWDPVFSGGQEFVPLDPDYLREVGAWLEQQGILTTALRSDELRDATVFNPQRFDALILPGAAYPWVARHAIQQFCSSGGILINLGGAPYPFQYAVGPAQTGRWVVVPPSATPPAPSTDITGQLLGLKNQGPAPARYAETHTPTFLLRKYLPDAPQLDQKLASPVLVPAGAQKELPQLYPLLRSAGVGGKLVLPQIFAIQNGSARALVVLDGRLTRPTGAPAGGWKLARETVVALALFARDLRTGDTQLEPQDRLEWKELAEADQPAATF